MPQGLRIPIPDPEAQGLEAGRAPKSRVTGSSFTMALNPITSATAMPGVTAGMTTVRSRLSACTQDLCVVDRRLSMADRPSLSGA